MTRRPRETYVSPQQHSFDTPSPAAVRRRRSFGIGAAVIVAVAIAVTVAFAFMSSAALIPGVPGAGPGGKGGSADGAIPLTEPISPFDTEHDAVSGLEPAIRDAIQAAATDAATYGIDIELTSGWRSADYQAGLLRDAIEKYGSEAAAREFVSTPEASKHVSGQAVDIARVDPALWLEQYGSEYGLCRVFANESWHFELATEPGGVCPDMLANASEAG